MRPAYATFYGMDDTFFIRVIYQHYGLQKDSVILLRHGINRTYRATDDNNQAVIIRVQSADFRDRAWISAELEYCSYINQMGLTANQAIANKSGGLISVVESDNHYYLTAFNCFSGVEIDIHNKQLLTADNLQLFGNTLGQLHNFAEGYQPGNRSRPGFQQILDHVPQNNLQPTFLSIKNEYFENIASLEQRKDNFGLIHGDFKFDNMLLSHGQFQLFDFDHSFYYFYVADLLLPLKIYFCLPGLGFYPASNQQIDEFLQPVIVGYRQRRVIDGIELQRLPILMQGSFIRAYIELNYLQHMDDYSSNELMPFIEKHLDYNNRLMEYDFGWSLK
ncbi:MAG: phosphotransferase [Coxiellaceae bacterium]|nr:phosphotransferase [Coxiellaceae bacterium]